MKKLFLVSILSIAILSLKAQDEKVNERFLKKENLFVGGTLNLGFGNQTTSLGIAPFFGYSFNKFVDFAVSFLQ